MTKDYNSVYSDHIQQFITMKRKLGFKFVKDAKLLFSIDVLATESGQITQGITKDFADLWIKKTFNESSRNHYQRAICLKHFSTFLCGFGIQSYIPKLPPPPKTTFIPHIYSPFEVNALFEASDKLRIPNSCTSCSLICLPLLIRTLYSTGIRIGEALALKNEDVNLLENYLRVRNSVDIHLWAACDQSWRYKFWLVFRPISCGAESFLAGTASCRIQVTGIDELYKEMKATGVIYNAETVVEDQSWGHRDFPTLDLHGNLITFYEIVK
jgi:integrase